MKTMMPNPFFAEYQTTVWSMPAEYLQAFCNQVQALPMSTEPVSVTISAPAAQKQGEVAVIGIRGTLLKSVPAIYRLWGLNVTGYNDIIAQINAAASDPTVKKIHLSIESPGGQVAGVQEAASAIAAANAIKPVTAVIDDLCCSGAYYLASQAGRIESNRNAIIGSVGAYSVFYDYSKMAENEGIRAVVIASGPHKGMGVPGTAITDEQIAAYQDVIDGMGESFKAAVKTGRQMTDEQVASISSGRVWLAPQAKTLGLIDKIQMATKPKTGAKIMAENEIAAPVVATAPVAAAKKTASITELKTAFPNHAEFVLAQIEAGASMLEAKAAFADTLAAENKTLMAKVADAEKKAAAAKTPDGASPIAAGGEGGSTAADFITLAKERSSEKKITLAAAMSAIASEQPQVYKAHLSACSQTKAPIKDKDSE